MATNYNDLISTTSGYQPTSPIAGNPYSDDNYSPTNYMQQSAPSTTSGYQPAYDPHPAAVAYDASDGDPNAPAAAQANGGQPVNAMQNAAPTTVSTAAPSHRMSLAQIIGGIGDTLAAFDGKRGMYQGTLDDRARFAQQQTAGDLDNQAKRQDIAQTGVATDTARAALVGQYARGLQAIAKGGGNVTAAAPLLARQLGIPDEEASMIGHAYAQDPSNLDALVAATDPVAKAGAGGPKFGNQLYYTKDAKGQVHAYQPSSGGGVQEVKFGDGETVADPTQVVNAGDRQIVVDKRTGTAVRSFQKQGAPDTGAYVTKGPDGQPIYTPIPGSSLQIKRELADATIAARSATTDAARQKVSTARATLAAGQQDALTYLDNLEAGFGKLQKLGALPGQGIAGALGRTHIGQAIGAQLGTEASQTRIEMTKNINQLQAKMVAALPASASRNKFEQEILAKSLPDPSTMTYATGMKVIGELRATYRRAIAATNAEMPPLPGRSTLAAPARATSKPTVVNW